MCVLVFGSGVIGIISVWYFWQVGFEVMVVDCQFGLVLEISFVNVGQLLFGYILLWVVFGVLFKVVKWLFFEYVLLVIWFGLDWYQYCWFVQMLCNCIYVCYVINKVCMVCMFEYSCDCFNELCIQIGIQFEGCDFGIIQLFCIQQQLDVLVQDIEIFVWYDVFYEVLDWVGIIVYELVLVVVVDILVGVLCLFCDQIGDCQLFICCLVQMCVDVGVEFCFDQDIVGLQIQGDCIIGVYINGVLEIVDCYVVVLGSYLLVLVDLFGLCLFVYLLKGYLLMLLIINLVMVFIFIILDESYKVVVICFDDCICVGGMVEVGGFDLFLLLCCCVIFEKVVCDLYLEGGDLSCVEFWIGLCLVMFDGILVIGVMFYCNLFFNIGYGIFGWMMVCGFGCYFVDLMSVCQLQISIEGLDIFCYGYVVVFVCYSEFEVCVLFVC